MKATVYDYAKLSAEGVVFRTKPKRGWYYKGQFIGYNACEAIEAINAIRESSPH